MPFNKTLQVLVQSELKYLNTTNMLRAQSKEPTHSKNHRDGLNYFQREITDIKRIPKEGKKKPNPPSNSSSSNTVYPLSNMQQRR